MNMNDYLVFDELDGERYVDTHVLHRLDLGIGHVFDDFVEADYPMRMFVWSRRLPSPSELPTEDIDDFLEAVAGALPDSVDFDHATFESAGIKRRLEMLEDATSIARVYYMDHSDFAYSTSPFCDPWDSGCVGVVYWPNAQLIDFDPDTHSRETAIERFREKAADAVKRYNAWAHGDIWVIDEDRNEALNYVCALSYDLEDELKLEIDGSHRFVERDVDEEELERLLNPDSFKQVHGFLWPLNEHDEPVRHGDAFMATRHVDSTVSYHTVDTITLSACRGMATLIDADGTHAIVVDVAHGERVPVFD